MISGWYLQRAARPPVVQRSGIAAGSNLVLGFLIKVDVHFFFSMDARCYGGPSKSMYDSVPVCY